jgi:hypothetical protein
MLLEQKDTHMNSPKAKMTRLATLVPALMVVITAVAAGATKPEKVYPRPGDRASALAISGTASSARNCIGPSGANVHALGWVPSNSRVVITFTSDFDPVASTTLMQLGQDAPDSRARASFVYDDDSGGNLEPELRFTTAYSGTLVLHVSKFSAEREAGCYFYKVEIITG